MYNSSVMCLLSPLVLSDWGVLLRGMFSADAEGPEDGIWRGHHRNPDSQKKEGRSEEETGTALHQLLSDHVIHQTPDHSADDHKPNLDCWQATKCTKKERNENQETRATFKLRGSWKAITLVHRPTEGCSLLPKEHRTQVSRFIQRLFASKVPSFITIYNHFLVQSAVSSHTKKRCDMISMLLKAVDLWMYIFKRTHFRMERESLRLMNEKADLSDTVTVTRMHFWAQGLFFLFCFICLFYCVKIKATNTLLALMVATITEGAANETTQCSLLLWGWQIRVECCVVNTFWTWTVLFFSYCTFFSLGKLLFYIVACQIIL